MLIGRRAMDKSRPSRGHNLVEWARPLLNHNKKLLRILDSGIKGRYSYNTLMKVANLAYLCLSQNPKGRPAMSLVIEMLEPLVTQMSREDVTLQSGRGCVILYEVPKEMNRNELKSESKREGETGKSKYGTRRSKSEPPKELNLYDPSTDALCNCRT
ncbi:hypothetical protein BUALT_Bualt09G0051600 [Buddleja alternifolia]|uniref:Uncharacterized protein n=1 Tax=Buddleja alternifolia TaxID=168488 RepID=A0AAV6X0Q1_9LAMI|nr:hypothetical protein BUALT_Bualt09G0051600 [Buddleja alternifolia]